MNNSKSPGDEYDEGMSTFSSPFMIHIDMSLQDATATVLFNLGQLLSRMGEIEDALTFFLRALSFVPQEDKLEKSQVGGVTPHQLLSCIGNIQYRKGQYEDAVLTYSKALEMARSSALLLESHHMLGVAAILNSLGVLYFHIPSVEASKALDIFFESLSIYRAVLGFDAETKEIATLLNNIGRVHYMSKNHQEAIKYYSESLAIRRRLFGNDHLDVAATICNAGQAKHQMRQLDEAMVLYKEFLVIAKKRLT